MKRRLLVVVSTMLCSMLPVAAWAAPSEPGTVQTLRSYDADAFELPEGVAMDKRGRLYVTMTFLGELRRIDTDGSEHLVATLPTGSGFGPLGLAVDATGDVYACVVTFDAETHGVWRVTPSGQASRLPGTQDIGFPNGLTFDDRGALYVTDSMNGAVWRVGKGGTALWLQSALLEGDGSAPLPFPIGANGIAHRQGALLVTNTERASIVRVPIEKDGTAGAPAILAQDAALGGADGVALDVHGNPYVAVIAQSTVVRVDGQTGAVGVIADGDDGLDFASSLVFGTARGEQTSLYAVNFSVGPLFDIARTHGPGVISITAGVPGLPQP